ncbi:MAG: hypothetical protein ABH858_00680, partial [Candidatus Omnitrophota bacterium]
MSKAIRVFFVFALVLAGLKFIDHFFLGDRFLSWRIYRSSSGETVLYEVPAFNLRVSPRSLAIDSEEAERVRRQLESKLIASRDKTILYTKDGRRLEGIKVSEDDKDIKFKQIFGSSGAMVITIAKENVAGIEQSQADKIGITDEEVLIKNQFPDFDFYRQGQYSFFTDETYFRIAESIDVLKNLSDAFMKVFSPALDRTLKRRSYVLIFSNSDDFYAYCRKVAPGMAGAVGLYSPLENKLMVYNFFGGKNYKMVEEYVEGEKARVADWRKQDLDYRSKQAVSDYQHKVSSYIKRYALDTKAMNLEVFRHESAHQLSYDLGMIQGNNFDIWLIEGV